LGRHPILSLRRPQSTAAVRIKGFTPENVAAFFDIFEKEMEKINFSQIVCSMSMRPVSQLSKIKPAEL
jgi:hypothetical protein